MPSSRTIPFLVDEYYHVFNRGIDKRIIFSSPNDFERFSMLLYVCNSTSTIRLDNLINFHKKSFTEVLREKREDRLVSIGAWCCMHNHFHLLLKEERPGGISLFMKKIGTGYSMYFNKKYQRDGALFGGRFKAVHIEHDTHLQHLFAYIHLNPLDISFPKWKENFGTHTAEELKRFLSSYRYSSYTDYLNMSRAENVIVEKDAFPACFELNSFEKFVDVYLVSDDSEQDP